MSAGLAHGPAGVVHVTHCNSPPPSWAYSWLMDQSLSPSAGSGREQGDNLQYPLSSLQTVLV